MKRPQNAPPWLPATMHLAHGLIAGGAGYLLARAAVLYTVAAPGSMASIAALAAAFGLAMFEIAFLGWLIARRRRMRRLWREAAQYIRADEYAAAEMLLLELLAFQEYRAAPQAVLVALGACVEGQGHDREALVLYRRCGDYEPALRAIGTLQLERGLNEAAADALRKLVARNPDDVIAAVLLALALVRAGHHDAALRVLRRALEHRPKSEMLRQNLLRVESGEEPTLQIERPAR